MADSENPRPNLPGENKSAAGESGVVSIAISEENLAALLGSDVSAPKPEPPVKPVEAPATLAPLSAAQEKPLNEVSAPASPVLPKRSETVDSTLALFAAIKESRAEALKSEAHTKPVLAGPETISIPAVVPPLRSKGTVFPARAGQSAPIPKWAAQTSAPQSGLAGVFEKIPGGKKTILAVGVILAIGGITAGLLTRGNGTVRRPSVPTPTVAAPAVNNFPLQLQTIPDSNGSINLRWNPQSTLIGQASEGRLVITENNQKPLTVGVSLDQLKFGHMTYQARSERVEFRLEVVDRSGAVAEESILTLVPSSTVKTGSSVSQQNSSATVVQTPPQAVAPAPATSPTTSPAASPAEEAPKAARPAARPFTPPTNQRPAVLGAIEAPPSLAGANPALPEPALGAQVPRVAPPPAAPVSAPAPQQVQIADNIQAANLVKRITPIYPTIAKAARIQGTVRFNAVISATGVIRDLQVVSGPPQLRQAATDAVRQWVYRPMTRNGRPVEVVTQIDVNFTLN